jgi:hypothetical protein
VRLISRLFGLLALCMATQAGAAAFSAAVMPGRIQASLNSTLPTPLIWTVQVTGVSAATGAGIKGAAGVPPVLMSPQATVTTANGQILQVDPQPLMVRLSASGQGTATEYFTLSPATIVAALHLGVGTLLLRRTFGVPPYGGVATAVIYLGGSNSGPLALSRVSLHFDDRSRVRVVHANEPVVAIAEINYSGSGVLNGLWEAASPPTTQGEPVFIPVAAATVNLAGGGVTEVTSPPLPASMAGRYFVRFRVRSPLVPFDGLVLAYAVEADTTGTAPITIHGPAPHATLRADTRFQWQPAAGAIAYRLEFYSANAEDRDRPPISGEWLPGAQVNARLTALAQSHLQPGQTYRWRIVALNGTSQIVGRSALYEIHTP